MPARAELRGLLPELREKAIRAHAKLSEPRQRSKAARSRLYGDIQRFWSVLDMLGMCEARAIARRRKRSKASK